MGNDLSDDETSKLCIMMRIIDLFHKNLKKFEKLPKMKKENKSLSSEQNEIIRTFSDEQSDKVLEIHKLQMMKLDS